MKKILIVLLAVLLVWAAARPAEAGHGRGGAFLLGLGLGLLLVPPLVHAAPPPVVVYKPHHPLLPPAECGRFDGPPSDRVWVPGHWVRRWNERHRVWERFWVPGHWKYC
jgi:hypothetical protein